MKTLSRLFIIIMLAIPAIAGQAQDKPRWASKGAGHLQDKRSNDTYRFVKFETFGGDLTQLRNEQTRPLIEYLASTFGLEADKAEARVISTGGGDASLPNDAEGSTAVSRDYKVTFSGAKDETFYARLVDEYVTFDENIDLTYDFTLYQLYAVATAGGAEPVYDDYSFTRNYNAKALALSIIPGLGQLYKGQNTKAYCIWGGEAVFAAFTIAGEMRRHQYSKDRDNARLEGHHDIADSYHSKMKSWRTVRNIAICGLVGVYVYNLADAAISKGARQVIVKKKNGTQLSLQPGVVYDPSSTLAPAVGMSLTF